MFRASESRFWIQLLGFGAQGAKGRVDGWILVDIQKTPIQIPVFAGLNLLKHHLLKTLNLQPQTVNRVVGFCCFHFAVNHTTLWVPSFRHSMGVRVQG